MSSTQSQQQGGSKRTLRLLSLGAGGVHSVSTLNILERIMAGLNSDRAPGKKLEPYQVFDMIGGVGTGGLIAIMLGRLHMSLHDCTNAFKELCANIYQPADPKDIRRHARTSTYEPNNKFDSSVLEQSVKKMSPNSEDLFEDPNNPCKVFVTLVPDGSKVGFRIVSSYPDPRGGELNKNCKVSEVCRATTASPGFFNRVKMTGSSSGYCPSDEMDQPTVTVAREWCRQWPGQDGLVIDIGSGVQPNRTFGESTFKDILENGHTPYHKDMWFRFNRKSPLGSLSHILQEDYDKFDLIEGATASFLDTKDVQDDLGDCIDKLRLISFDD